MDKIRKFGVSTFALKLIAILTMAIDHTGAVLFPEYIFFRIIGRLAFPIFCFLIVEGYFRTKNIYKYGLRLLVFAFLSEIPFDLAFSNTYIDLSHQNVFFTLFLGLMVIYIGDKTLYIVNKVIICFVGMGLAYILQTDYSLFGILMIFSFYVFRKRKDIMCVSQFVINVFLIGQIQMFAVFSLIPICLYNGRKGYGRLKFVFYLFYPTHLCILYILKELLLQ